MLLASSATSAGSDVGAIFIFLIAVAAYFVPTIVALVRKPPSPGMVYVLNFFLGWTVVGWVIALMLAVRSRPAAPQYVVPTGWQPPQQLPPDHQPPD